MKTLIDRHRWQHFSELVQNDFYRPQPEEFIRVIFPFLTQLGKRTAAQSLVEVDPGLVIGFDSVSIKFKGIAENPERNIRPTEFCNQLDDYTRRGTTGSAEGYRNSQLGIYWLYEGLSRPQLSASLNRNIPIYVNDEDFLPEITVKVIALSGPLSTVYYLQYGSQTSAIIFARFLIPLLVSSGIELVEERSSFLEQLRVLRSSYERTLYLYRSALPR